MPRLEWGDELSVPFDSTVIFGHGYDFNCLDSSLTAAGPNGNYRMWSRSGARDGKYVHLYSLYRDSDGALAFERYLSIEECMAAAERWCDDDVEGASDGQP